LPRLLTNFIRWGALLLCATGGVLWALSPLGVYLSELEYRTTDVFWKLFPSAPLLLLVGLMGLHARLAGRSGRLGRTGSFVAFSGLVLVLAGDIGEFWLGIDDTYLLMAPAYHAFRAGLTFLGVGSVLFGLGALRAGALPPWGALPFVLGSVGGLISFSRDLGYVGATLWILYGVGWVWLGLVPALEVFLSLRKKRRARS
jgi:hypothetical protein